jgi:hypothetical protein
LEVISVTSDDNNGDETVGPAAGAHEHVAPPGEQPSTNAALSMRAQRALNDAKFVPTEEDRLRVQIEIAAGASLTSIARRLRPPAGISVRVLRKNFGPQINYGADALRAVLLMEKLRVARGGHDATAYDVTRASSELLNLIEPSRKRTRKGHGGQAGREGDLLEVPVTLNLGNNPPNEGE